MKVQEAIDLIKQVPLYRYECDLEKCRQSDLFNALNIAINCMEKQIPKNPIVKPLGQDIEVECPTCGNVHIFLDTKKGDKYCNHCGQKIDWEEGGTSD